MLYLFLFVVLSIVFAVGIPMLQLINIKSWASSSVLIEQSRDAAQDIADPQVSAGITAVLQSQLDALQTNVETLGFFNQYAWFFIGIVIFVVIFLFIREQKEIEGVYG